MPPIDLELGSKLFKFLIRSLRYFSKHAYRFLPAQEVVDAEGTYLGFVYSNGKLRVLDVVAISRSGRHSVEGKPLFDHYTTNRYRFNLTSTVKNRGLFIGTWEHEKKIYYYGSCMFRNITLNGDNVLDGVYLGPTESWTLRSSEWKLVKLSDRQFTYNSFINSNMRSLKRRFITKFTDVKVNKNLLDGIIDKHKVYFAESDPVPFTHEGLFFEIPNNGFNPKFGKISRDMIMHVLNKENMNGRSFLDVGCGSGFYALLAAKRYSCSEIVGLDCDNSLIEVAKRNQKRNLSKFESKNIHFLKDDPLELFKSLRLDKLFDVIVANMPFSNHNSCRKHKDTTPELYRNFVCDERVLFSLIMGTKMHLAEQGTMYMSFGDSGYKKSLDEYIESAGLVRTTEMNVKGRDDNFYVYALKHKHEHGALFTR